jgi:hypothetical protein
VKLWTPRPYDLTTISYKKIEILRDLYELSEYLQRDYTIDLRSQMRRGSSLSFATSYELEAPDRAYFDLLPERGRSYIQRFRRS